MPETTVACPHCQQSIRVMTEHAGNQVACPFCQNAMVVPEFEAAEPASVADNVLNDVAPPHSLTFACSHCARPFQVSGDSLGLAVSCPSCGNAVQLPDTPQSSAVEAQLAESKPHPKPRPKPRPRPRLRPRRESKPASEPAVEPIQAAPVSQPIAPEPKVTERHAPVGKNTPVLISPEQAAQSKRNANAPIGLGSARSASGDLLPPKYEALLPRMSDIALSADGKAVASMSFQEPVKTIRVNGNERVLRRLSPEEKITRRRQRNAVLFLLGMLFLGVVVAILVRK